MTTDKIEREFIKQSLQASLEVTSLLSEFFESLEEAKHLLSDGQLELANAIANKLIVISSEHLHRNPEKNS